MTKTSFDGPFDTHITDELLSTTRAVRKRLDLDQPVDPAVILECIALAQQAPTAANEQNWRWVVVTDADKKAQLADIYRGGCLTYLERGAVEEEDDQTRRVYQSALQLAKTIEHVPLLVIPCVERRLDGLGLTALASTFGSIIPAAWSFVLALRSRGLGTVWTTAHLSNERAAAALLGIPEGVTQVAMFPVAHTIGFDFKPADRPPPESITSWNSWEGRL
jgi:nitroreductase